MFRQSDIKEIKIQSALLSWNDQETYHKTEFISHQGQNSKSDKKGIKEIIL